MTLRIFDPPQCCSTGVCGPDVDPTLVQFAADLKWLAARGVSVERFNLAQQPEAFVREAAVREAIGTAGTGALPVVVVDGRIVSHSSYPGRDALTQIAGLAEAEPEPIIGLDVVSGPASGSCCSPDGGTSDSDCC